MSGRLKGKVAESTVSKGWNMHVPTGVRTYFGLKEGGVLEWHSPHVDIPDPKMLDDMLLVRVKRDETGRIYGSQVGNCDRKFTRQVKKGSDFR